MLRLLGDENLNGDIIKGLRSREPSLDLVRALDVGLGSTPDPIILDWAAGQARVLLTHDRKTMVGYAYQRVKAGLGMPGVVVVDDNMGVGDAVDQVLIVVVCYTPEETKDRVIFVPL
jgi:hypothetical protein